MKPKNVMLLGFVNRAVKYLDDHLNDRSDPKLKEIKDIDFLALQDQLRKDLNVSLGTMQSTVRTLLQAGEEAFDDFMGLHLEQDTLSNELDRIFDNKEEKKPVGKVEDLDELLSFYNLGNLDLSEEEEEAPKEEIPTEVAEELAEQPLEEPEVQEEETTDDVSEFFVPEEETEETVSEEHNEEEPETEEVPFEVPEGPETAEVPFDVPEGPETEEQPDEVPEEKIPQDFEIPTEEEVEETPLEVFEEETEEVEGPQTEEVPETAEEETEEPAPEEESIFLMSDEDSELLRQIAENVNRQEETVEETEEPVAEEKEDQNLDSIFSEVLAHEDEEQPEVETFPEVPAIDADDLVRLAQDIDEKHNMYYKDLPISLEEEESKEEAPEEVLPEDSDDDEEEEIPVAAPEEEEVYVSSLIEELKQRMLEEEEQKRAQEEEYRQIYDRIHRIYPNLSNAFIRTVYDLKESIANEYPLNREVIVLHRCIFKDVESLRQFVEIALSHNFSINADEGKLMVDAIKEYMNADGKIITSIFEVANQAAVLGGEYDGYRVMLEEKA